MTWPLRRSCASDGRKTKASKALTCGVLVIDITRTLVVYSCRRLAQFVDESEPTEHPDQENP